MIIVRFLLVICRYRHGVYKLEFFGVGIPSNTSKNLANEWRHSFTTGYPALTDRICSRNHTDLRHQVNV